MKKFLAFLIVVGLFVASILIPKYYSQGTYVGIINSEGKKLNIISDVADSMDERSQGLSGKTILGEDKGMLFIFQENTNSPFWMKDMNFPLDIIFINDQFEITDIKQNIAPCVKDKECPKLEPITKYRYVLEVNSNYTKENNVKIGNKITIK